MTKVWVILGFCTYVVLAALAVMFGWIQPVNMFVAPLIMLICLLIIRLAWRNERRHG